MSGREARRSPRCTRVTGDSLSGQSQRVEGGVVPAADHHHGAAGKSVGIRPQVVGHVSAKVPIDGGRQPSEPDSGGDHDGVRHEPSAADSTHLSPRSIRSTGHPRRTRSPRMAADCSRAISNGCSSS